MADGIKKELDFSLNNFQEQKTYEALEAAAQIILNLFFTVPGDYPSLPHIGLDIKQYLYKLEDEIDPEELKGKIFAQCSELMPYLILGNVRIFMTNYKGKPVLIANIQLNANDQSNDLTMAFSENNGNLLYDYAFNTDLFKNLF